MGYYVSNMIGIRTGGVFAGAVDQDNMRERIEKVRTAVIDANPNIEAVPSGVSSSVPQAGALSHEINGNKGSYVVIAGVFNYWTYGASSLFAQALSKEFGCEVMHMCWDEEREEVQCQIWLAGQAMLEVAENPIGRILRRVV